jgi:FkbM family methyltransferase
MRVLKAGARRAARAVEFTVLRAGRENRFDASAAVLRQMAARGFAPRIVIDCGANRGQWTDMASRIVPAARFQLIEPQHGCHEALARLPASRFTLHRVGVTAPGVENVRMIGGGDTEDSTGAFVAPDGFSSPAHAAYPATTLDALLATTVTRADRTLLKLDIEGHDLEALEGATAVLSSVECVLSEVRFFDVHQSGFPVFADIMGCLRERDFELYEIAGSQDASTTAGCASGTWSSFAATARSPRMSGSSSPWWRPRRPRAPAPVSWTGQPQANPPSAARCR